MLPFLSFSQQWREGQGHEPGHDTVREEYRTWRTLRVRFWLPHVSLGDPGGYQKRQPLHAWNAHGDCDAPGGFQRF